MIKPNLKTLTTAVQTVLQEADNSAKPWDYDVLSHVILDAITNIRSAYVNKLLKEWGYDDSFKMTDGFVAKTGTSATLVISTPKGKQRINISVSLPTNADK